MDTDLKQSIRRMYREVMESSSSEESILDAMSDHLNKVKQKEEMSKKTSHQAGVGPLVARYHSDPTLCQCKCGERSPWSRELCESTHATESQREECWPNTNPEISTHSHASAAPETTDYSIDSMDRNGLAAQSSNDPHNLRSIFTKPEKKERLVTFQTSSPATPKKTASKSTSGDGVSLTVPLYHTPPMHIPGAFSSPDSSVLSATAEENSSHSRSLKH